MRNFRFIETIVTQKLVSTGILVVLVVVSAFSLVLFYGFTDVKTLATFVDALFKASALLIGALWALNRYFVNRMDATQMKVVPHVEFMPAIGKDNGLVLFHLEILNTGSILIGPYEQFLELSLVRRIDGELSIDVWQRWPEAGFDESGPIEPKSLAAIDDAVSLPSNTVAAKLYLQMHLNDGNRWTWHRTFMASKLKDN